jgi:hypothetical protein
MIAAPESWAFVPRSRRAAAVASRQTDSRRTLSGDHLMPRPAETCATGTPIPSKEGRSSGRLKDLRAPRSAVRGEQRIGAGEPAP